jgi:hypothetical protein
VSARKKGAAAKNSSSPKAVVQTAHASNSTPSLTESQPTNDLGIAFFLVKRALAVQQTDWRLRQALEHLEIVHSFEEEGSS